VAVGKLLLTVENTMMRLRGKSKMKDKLLKLHDYLLSNGYIKDADRIYSILEEYENENKLSDLSAQKLIVMCNPKYLGNYYIREFDDLYKWWNFLAEIVSGIR